MPLLLVSNFNSVLILSQINTLICACFHLMPSSCLLGRLSIPFTPPPELQSGSTVNSFQFGMWKYPSLLSPNAFPPCRRSGTDWLGTLFLIRRMAWGETLIWTSSAWKRTALPGWAESLGTTNYPTFVVFFHAGWFILLSVRVRASVREKGICRDFVLYNPFTHLTALILSIHEYQ